MLMAAGLGTRLKPYSDHLAKPLIPIMGVPCAQFAVDALASAGVDRVVANIHHLPEATRVGLESMDLGGASLEISDESGLLLGSAGGLRKALPLFEGERFFISNADVLCSVDWQALARTHARLREQWGVRLTLALMPIPGDASESYRQIQVDPSAERVVGLGPKARNGLMYMGCAVIEPELIAGLPEGLALEFVPEILEPAIRNGLAGAYLMDGLWMDVGSPGLWWKAHAELLARMETGDLPSSWRHRIEGANRRLAPGVWCSNRVSHWVDTSEWQGPSFWDPVNAVGGWGRARKHAPHQLGPGTVLYGEPQPGTEGRGVGAFGHWTQLGTHRGTHLG